MHSKKTVLIVEDEEPILMALQRILELTGDYEAVVAQDGAIAMDKLQSFVPDLIISDISMPNLNGIDLCKRVRENPVTKSVPFIFLTAKKEKMLEGLNVGGDDFLMKPFNVDEVLIKIETMFRRVAQSREQASQHKGRIEDVPVEEIIELCLREKISGELILQREGQVGTVNLDHGDIVSVSYNSLKDEAALDAMRKWTQGTFVVRPLDIKIKVDPQLNIEKTDLKFAGKLMENVWWVGHIDEKEAVHQNVYLRVFKNDSKKICALFDPGSPLYFNAISEKIDQALGGASKINIYIPLDSSPEASLNSRMLRQANERVICMTSTKNWDYIKHYEIHPRSVKKVDIEKTPSITLASGHNLQFIETPFCGSASSFMTYDIESRVLFSGSLFSSDSKPTTEKTNDLYAKEKDWEGMRSYHQKNISSNSALLKVLENVKWLEPKPLVIAPRFGKLINGEDVELFIDRLKVLNVGIDKIFYEALDK
ncbi:MAG: response regulator [Calditrichaeota bacterium]|nr:MAG: response regulator [Calditrichota bacterium]MBL1206416.1 response regulator [Calditrichota bacterium]NOG46242.1 response regulator [Calditrichota bacterium]